MAAKKRCRKCKKIIHGNHPTGCCWDCREEKHWREFTTRRCESCDAPIKMNNKSGYCAKCGRHVWTTKEGRKTRIKPRPKIYAVCKLCDRRFYVRQDQDARYTWWCPACRQKVRDIEPGIRGVTRGSYYTYGG